MRHRDDHDVLFAKSALSDALSAHIADIPNRVQSISETVLRAVDDTDLTAQLAEGLKIVPLRLEQSRQTMRREEIQIDVTDDPRRFGSPDGRRIIVPGIRVTISIPYIGDEQLWRFRPSTYQLSAPRGTVLTEQGADHGVLELVIEQTSDEPLENIKLELDRRLNDILFYIESQAKDLAGIDNTIQQKIVVALTARRGRLKRHDDLVDLLGIPETSDLRPSPPMPVGRHKEQPKPHASTPESWDAFVSHASEDKESFVRPLVAALTAAGIKVWFDEYELRIGDSLRRSIDSGLALSRFGIVVISNSFLAKHWPQKELDGLVSMEESGNKVVLPIWHEITAAEIRLCSPTLADRLAVSSSRGVEEVVKELLRVIRPT